MAGPLDAMKSFSMGLVVQKLSSLAKQSQVLAYYNGVVVGYPPHDAIDGSSGRHLSNRTRFLHSVAS
jgi:hypothetical protein